VSRPHNKRQLPLFLIRCEWMVRVFLTINTKNFNIKPKIVLF